MAKSFVKALIAPEYTDHPAPCLRGGLPVRRGFDAHDVDFCPMPGLLASVMLVERVSFAITFKRPYLASLRRQ
jgi:hypothetical protein